MFRVLSQNITIFGVFNIACDFSMSLAFFCLTFKYFTSPRSAYDLWWTFNIGIEHMVHIITDSIVLWKIRKFDWLIPETNWHSCLHNRALCMHNRTLCSKRPIQSSRVEPEKNYWFLINKNLQLFDRAMICSNNSLLWRIASLFTAVIKITTRVTCVTCAHQKMITWKQYSAKFKDFQNMKFTELSRGAFTFMNIYIILTFLAIIQC